MMTYEQMVGLEPHPDGTILAMVNPFDKTVYFERHTDWGPVKIDPPADAVLPDGYRLITP